MNKPWENLPNAHHIDRVMSDLLVNTDNWSLAYDRTYSMSLDANAFNWNSMWILARESLTDRNLYDLWMDISKKINASGNSGAISGAIIAAESTILGLISSYDAGDLLNVHPDQVKIMLLLGGSQSSLLVYPGCLALSLNEGYGTRVVEDASWLEEDSWSDGADQLE